MILTLHSLSEAWESFGRFPKRLEYILRGRMTPRVFLQPIQTSCGKHRSTRSSRRKGRGDIRIVRLSGLQPVSDIVKGRQDFQRAEKMKLSIGFAAYGNPTFPSVLKSLMVEHAGVQNPGTPESLSRKGTTSSHGLEISSASPTR